MYGITYSTAKSAVVNNNSIYETKTVSGDLTSGKKQTTTKRFDVKVLSREEYMYSSAPNGLSPRHEARMLPTANSEQQSTPRSRVYTTSMSVLRLLYACDYNIVSRVTQRGEGSFFSFKETALVVLNLRCEGEMEGRLQSEPTCLLYTSPSPRD